MTTFKVALVSIDAPEVPSWVIDEITASGIELAVQECKNAEEVVEVASDSHLVWVFGGGRVVSEECLPLLEECVVILRSGSGTDNIPVGLATELGIIVANTPQATCETVSDHTITLLFSLVRKIVYQDRRIQKGEWNYRDMAPPMTLSGKTIGFLGFGNIARRVVGKLVGFNFEFIAYDPYADKETFQAYGVQSCSFEGLLTESDILSIHCPLKDDTFHLIDEKALRRMKPTSVIINTSRGAIIDEKALYKALLENRIGGAALDVVETTPDKGAQPLVKLDNVILTPHMAGYVEKYLDPFWEYSVKTVLDVANGNMPASYVNPEVKARARHLKELRTTVKG